MQDQDQHRSPIDSYPDSPRLARPTPGMAQLWSPCSSDDGCNSAALGSAELSMFCSILADVTLLPHKG